MHGSASLVAAASFSGSKTFKGFCVHLQTWWLVIHYNPLDAFKLIITFIDSFVERFVWNSYNRMGDNLSWH